MYDSHIFSKEYKNLKDQVVDLLNGDEHINVEVLSDHIHELYSDGGLSSSQYDDLMNYIIDMT